MLKVSKLLAKNKFYSKMNRIFSLKTICLEKIVKNKKNFSNVNLPFFINQSVSDVYFKSQYATNISYINVIFDILGKRCIVSGGYASFVCERTSTFKDIDIFTIVKNEEEIGILVKKLKKNFLQVKVDENYFKFQKKYLKVARVNFGFTKVDIVFKKVEDSEINFYLSNWINFTEKVLETTDLEINKYVGFPLANGSFMFMSFAQEEIFTYKDEILAKNLQFGIYSSRQKNLNILKHFEPLSNMWTNFLKQNCNKEEEIQPNLFKFTQRVCKYFNRKIKENILRNERILKTYLQF